MKINRNNYEAFFIDYLDGNLAADSCDELQLFLLQNPDLAEELEEMKAMGNPLSFLSTSEEDLYPAKQALKKVMPSAEEDVIDLLLAKEIEGDITPAETALLQEKVELADEIAKRRKLFAFTRLKANHETYPHKESLQIPDSIDYSTIHDLLIAHCENDLTSDEKILLNNYLTADASIQSELNLYQRAYLQAPAIEYPNKAKLYRKETRVITLRAIYSSVAVAAMFTLILWMNFQDSTPALTAGRYTPHSQVERETSDYNSKTNEESPLESNPRTLAATAPMTSRFADSNDGASAVVSPQPSHVPEKLKFRDIQSMETPALADLPYSTPPMNPVFDTPLPTHSSEQVSTTLLAYLGKVATDKLNANSTFNHAEKQFELLGNQITRHFEFQRIPIQDQEKIILRIGSFKIQKKVKSSKQGLRQKLANILSPEKEK